MDTRDSGVTPGIANVRTGILWTILIGFIAGVLGNRPGLDTVIKFGGMVARGLLAPDGL